MRNLQSFRRSPAFALFMALASLTGTSCSSCNKDEITCGKGTKLNKDTNECEADIPGDFNVVVDDFNVGKFAFTGVDVPEQMRPGFEDKRTFNITNTDTVAQEVVYVRVGIVPVDQVIDELRSELENLDSPASCETENDCSKSTNCNLDKKECELDVTWTSSVIIENLAAGEQRLINHTMQLPLGWNTNGMYGLLFSVNEVALEKDSNGVYQPNPDRISKPGEAAYKRAATLYAPATVMVGIPDKPNLRILYANLDTAALEVAFASGHPASVATLSSRLSAQGLSLKEPVTVRAELLVPGHVIQTPGKDLGEQYFRDHKLDYAAAPDTTVYALDENRKFNLLFRQEDGTTVPTVTLEPRCMEIPAEEAANQDCIRWSTIENDVGRDVVSDLYLSFEDTRLLYGSANYPTFNHIDANGEIAAKVRIITATTEAEYAINNQPLLADNVVEKDVVVMVPPASVNASDTDTDVPPGSQGQAGLVPCCGPYPEVSNITPTKAQSFGSEWLGASYQLKNTSSLKRQFDAVVAARFEADNYARLNILTIPIDIVIAQAHADFGTRRAISNNSSTGLVRILTNTLLEWNFDPTKCEVDGDEEQCVLVEFEVELDDDDDDGDNDPKPPDDAKVKKWKWSKSWEKKKYFTLGPVPFEISGELTAELGVSGSLGLFAEYDDDPMYGIFFSFGPVASVSIKCFGGISIAIARAGVEGSATIVEAAFQPVLKLGFAQTIDDTNNCWQKNEVGFKVECNLELKQLNGTISVVAYAGLSECWWGICISWEVKVLDFKIVEIAGFKQTIPVWGTYVGFGQGSGLCPGASSSWKTPTVCAGTNCNNYGANANGAGTYAKTWPIAAGKCASVSITGQSEANYDYLRFYNVNNTLLESFHGTLNNTTRKYCNTTSLTAKLTSDGSIQYPGFNVTFTEVNP